MSSSEEFSDRHPDSAVLESLNLVEEPLEDNECLHKVEHSKETSVDGSEGELQDNKLSTFEAFHDCLQKSFISMKKSISEIQDMYDEQLSKQIEYITQLQAEVAKMAESAAAKEVNIIQIIALLMEVKISINYLVLIKLKKKNLNDWTVNHLKEDQD